MPAQVWRFGFMALWHPELMAAGALIIALYLLPIVHRRQTHPMEPLRAASFIFGIVLLYAGVGTPLDVLSDQFLFSAHMAEHVFITLLAPPLILLGMPVWMLRRIIGRRLQKVVGFLTRPLVGILLFNIAFSVYHFPLLYEAGLHNDTIHFLQHAVLFVTAIFLWWPVVSPLPEMAKLSSPAKLLYLFLASIAMTPIFAILLFAPQPLYPSYLHTTQIFGLTPLQDQQLGAIIMKVSTLFAYGTAAGIVFFQWIAQQRVKDSLETLSVYRAGTDDPVVVRRPAPPPAGGSQRSAH